MVNNKQDLAIQNVSNIYGINPELIRQIVKSSDNTGDYQIKKRKKKPINK